MLPRWAIASGESVAASGGLAAAVVLATVVGLSSWWTLKTHRAAVEDGRTRQIASVVSLLRDAVESKLNAGELSQARALVARAAVDHGLETCRLVLGDGEVLADAQAARIGVKYRGASGEAWPPLTRTAADGVVRDGVLARAEAPVVVAGSGSAMLEVAAQLKGPEADTLEAWSGLLAIGGGGLSALLLAYRGMRQRLRALAAVRDALRAAAAGETSTDALSVSPTFGEEARTWNALLAQRDQLKRRVTLEQAAEKLNGRGGGDSDLAGACDALWMGLLVTDESGKIKYVNGAGAVLMQAKRADLEGKDFAAIVGKVETMSALTAVTGGKSRQRVSVEVEQHSKDGDRTVLRYTARPLRRNDTASTIVLIEDMTQQRVADESRNTFVAQAVHELRTPLTNIRAYAEVLLESEEPDPLERARAVNVINQEVRRLERTVGDMLSVAEIEAGSMKLRVDDVRLETVFEELMHDFEAQAHDKEIALAFDLPPKWPVMTADRDKLVLALHNLIGNALKYTPTGGAIRVSVKADEAAGLAVEVADNGIGIAPEEQELVFERFYRAKDRRIASISGSGIGLALARQVIRLQGGNIALHSEIDKGSTFTLTMPLQQQKTQTPRLAA